MQNIIWQNSKIDKNTDSNAFVLWFTGLSGSGKSTIAIELEKKLHELKKSVVLLDGDNIRHGLCSDLGFSVEDRKENLRRIREVAKLFCQNGTSALVSFITPFEEERKKAKELIGPNYIEIFVDCPLEVCQKRDPKGLYEKVKNGEISNFTGIEQEYQIPKTPDIIVNSAENSIEESINQILNYLTGKQYLTRE
jgi:adenylylsulfate kinase